jgi:hypothetical protein
MFSAFTKIKSVTQLHNSRQMVRTAIERVAVPVLAGQTISDQIRNGSAWRGSGGGRKALKASFHSQLSNHNIYSARFLFLWH